jgi:hypothetical protein
VTLNHFGAFIVIDSMNEGSDKVAYAFFADELNAYLTAPATSTGCLDTSQISCRFIIQSDSFLFFRWDNDKKDHFIDLHETSYSTF